MYGHGKVELAAGVSTDSHFDLFPIPSTDIGSNPNLIQNPRLVIINKYENEKILLFLSVLIMTFSFPGCKKDLTVVTINSTIKASQLSRFICRIIRTSMSDANKYLSNF